MNGVRARRTLGVSASSGRAGEHRIGALKRAKKVEGMTVAFRSLTTNSHSVYRWYRMLYTAHLGSRKAFERMYVAFFRNILLRLPTFDCPEGQVHVSISERPATPYIMRDTAAMAVPIAKQRHKRGLQQRQSRRKISPRGMDLGHVGNAGGDRASPTKSQLKKQWSIAGDP